MLRFSKELSADILKDFECGIQNMDEFIHKSLDSFLKEHTNYNFFVAVEEGQGIVGMFVTSSGIFIDHDGEFEDLPLGKPWGFLDKDSKLQSGTMYPTIEIDYLAVRKDLRKSGYGTVILTEISNMARDKGCYFLTVSAYYNREYSAIPFYEKRGFFALQEFSEERDTLRMAKRV